MFGSFDKVDSSFCRSVMSEGKVSTCLEFNGVFAADSSLVIWSNQNLDQKLSSPNRTYHLILKQPENRTLHFHAPVQLV